ncbi:hypothetical protein [Halorussus sp. MSC15.2]|uniref:DUF7284 family protein n=1 Tax=Halorussus sp. MSC15.2 TaxID=2283638 RepID=UPI0013D09D88|nr:hypothetical protein [Halorussus sp. MSC15.2]NEU57539.1 hypothetical protein [Halorussus sp. MSC15.2]
MRAISTVLDASLCLLLVSASALTLAATPTGPGGAGTAATDPDTADETAELLATSTALVTYDAGSRNRTAHDTLAGLLASAAVADSGPESHDGFVQAVTTRVGRTLRRLDGDAQVVARKNRPQSRASESNTAHEGRVVAGDAPPPDADVHAAAFAVRQVRLTVRTWSQ